MLLVQLPPDQERDDDRLDYFVRGLPEWMCVAVELRHPQLGRRSCLRPVEPPPRNLRGDESRRPPPVPCEPYRQRFICGPTALTMITSTPAHTAKPICTGGQTGSANWRRYLLRSLLCI